MKKKNPYNYTTKPMDKAIYGFLFRHIILETDLFLYLVAYYLLYNLKLTFKTIIPKIGNFNY